LKDVLGGILKIGNVMNAGNKNRGRADGFLLDSLSRSFSVKDVDGQSVMKIVIDQLLKKDESISKFKDKFSNCYKSLKSKAKDLADDTKKCQTQLSLKLLEYDSIKQADSDVSA